MAHLLNKPTNPYDPAWVEYRRQNPGLRLSLSAGSEDDGDDIDLSFIPEAYKGEDSKYDIAKFTTDYEGLVAFKSQADERAEAMPKDPSEYAFSFSDEFQFPEGFDPEAHRIPVVDDKGEPVLDDKGEPTTRAFTAADMIDANDPDMPLLQAALHEAGADKALMGKIGEILAGREIRGLLAADKTAEDEKKALGPDSTARINTVMHSINAMLPPAEAKAIADSITSADTLRGLEKVLKASKTPPPANKSTKIDNSTASIDERIMAGLQSR